MQLTQTPLFVFDKCQWQIQNRCQRNLPVMLPLVVLMIGCLEGKFNFLRIQVTSLGWIHLTSGFDKSLGRFGDNNLWWVHFCDTPGLPGSLTEGSSQPRCIIQPTPRDSCLLLYRNLSRIYKLNQRSLLINVFPRWQLYFFFNYQCLPEGKYLF